VFQNFKVKILKFLGNNGRLVRSSIVLKKPDSFRKPKTNQHPYVAFGFDRNISLVSFVKYWRTSFLDTLQ
jgi:hypothetical protein